MPKKGEYVKPLNFGKTIKSKGMIDADFESVVVSKYKAKQNPEESYRNKLVTIVAIN